MQTEISKLDFFLSLALMDQQFPLVVLESDGQKKELLRAIAATGKKFMETEDPMVLFEGSGRLDLIVLTPENIQKAQTIVDSLRQYGYSEQGGNLLQRPEFQKALFVVHEDTLSALSESAHSNLLLTFNPNFRFNH